MRILAAYLPLVTALETLEPAQLDALTEGLYAFGPTLDLPLAPPSSNGLANPMPVKAAAASRVPAPAPSAGIVILLDVTGCAGLFGKPMARGEAVLAHKAREFLGSLGLTAHVAIAEGPRLATLFAKLAHQPILVDKEHTVTALAEVPISLLPLTAREIDYFVKLGFGTAGDLMALPPASLGTRFERRIKDPRLAASRTVSGPDDLLLLLRGEDRAPLRAYVRKDPPQAGADLAYPTTSTEALSFVLKSLCDTLWCSMQGLSLRKVSVRLRIDKGARAREIPFTSTFAPALSNREDVLSALRAKLERTFADQHERKQHEDDAFGEVQRVDVRFDETVPTVLANLSLYSSEARASRALPKLLAELREGLGEAHVGRLAIGDSWQMDARSTLASYEHWRSADPRTALNVVEPTRFVGAVPLPESQSRAPLEPLRLVLRLDRDDWFVPAQGGESRGRREILAAWHDERAVCVLRSGPRTSLLGFFD